MAPQMHPGGIVALTRLADHLPRATAANRQAARDFLDERIAPHFDFDVMARRSAGPFYPRFSRAEREAFTARLRTMFIEALAGNLTSGTPAATRVDIYPTRFLRWGDEASVLAPSDEFTIGSDLDDLSIPPDSGGMEGIRCGRQRLQRRIAFQSLFRRACTPARPGGPPQLAGGPVVNRSQKGEKE